MAKQGKAGGQFLKTSDDIGVRVAACDHCFMGDAVESDAMSEKCILLRVRKFYGDR